jgi:hypothetical protein
MQNLPKLQEAASRAGGDTEWAMSHEHVEVVKRAVAAINDRDIDRYLGACTEDIELRVGSMGGLYEGADDIRRFFADIQDTNPDFRLGLERVEAVGADRVLAFLHLTGSGRVSGIPTAADTANVYELVDGRIARVQIFFSRQEALAAVGLPE